jgi:hypothetical protein
MLLANNYTMGCMDITNTGKCIFNTHTSCQYNQPIGQWDWVNWKDLSLEIMQQVIEVH